MSGPVSEEVSKEKERLKELIARSLKAICTGDHRSCAFGYCTHYKKCSYPLPDNANKKASRHFLKNILKTVAKANNKKFGRANPKASFTHTPHARISELLGQDIYEHELVIGDSIVTTMIRHATSLKEINNILEKKYNQVNKKPFSFSLVKKISWKRKIKKNKN